MTKTTLKEGEVYLSIALDVDILLAKVQRALINREEKIYIAAFKNENALENQPIYKSDSVAIWKRKKKSSDDVQDRSKEEEL